MTMNRRTFLAASALTLAVPGLTANAASGSMETFSDDSYKAAIASGEPFIVAVLSSW